MALLKCNSCGAEYRNPQRDGSTYYHACPPIIVIKARRDDGTEVEQPLDQFQGLTIVESNAAKKELVDAGGDTTKIVVERQRRAVRRDDHRDENTRMRLGDRGEQRVIRSEGKGVTMLKTDAQQATEDRDAL